MLYISHYKIEHGHRAQIKGSSRKTKERHLLSKLFYWLQNSTNNKRQQDFESNHQIFDKMEHPQAIYDKLKTSIQPNNHRINMIPHIKIFSI